MRYPFPPRAHCGPNRQRVGQGLDHVLDEIDAKAARITDQPRAEVFRRMADAIGKESSLDPADRQALADKLNEMGKAD